MKRYDFTGRPEVGEKFINSADGLVYLTAKDDPDDGICVGCAFNGNDGCASAPDCPADGHFVATGEIAPEETMTVHVCDKCGSANVLIDAWVHANDSDDVRTFDNCYCEDCDGDTRTVTVEVPITFDIYTDKFDLAALEKEES